MKKNLAKAGSLFDAFVAIFAEDEKIVVVSIKNDEKKTFYPKTFLELSSIVDDSGLDEEQMLHIYKTLTRRFITF